MRALTSPRTLFDLKAINNTRAATQRAEVRAIYYKDARDLVVLAVGYAYLQAIADEPAIETVAAQVKTAQALYNQAPTGESRNFARRLTPCAPMSNCRRASSN